MTASIFHINTKENSVVYTGTHDNDTVVGWYETLSEDDKKFLEHYLKYSTIEEQELYI